jgi:hypothetical protein
VSGDRSRVRTPVRSTGSGRPTNQIKTKAPVRRRGGKHCAFTPRDDEGLIDLKENKRLPWKAITLQFPGRSVGALQVRYCTKLKNRHLRSEDDSDSEESLDDSRCHCIVQLSTDAASLVTGIARSKPVPENTPMSTGSRAVSKSFTNAPDTRSANSLKIEI